MTSIDEVAPVFTSHVLLASDGPDTSRNDALVTYLADKYTALRIAGLEQSPQSFSATLQAELQLTAAEKIARILTPDKHIMVIVKRDAESTPSKKPWYDCEWIGQATCFGPLIWNECISPFTNTHANNHLSENELHSLAGPARLSPNISHTAYWHMTALYIDIAHRRLGLAKKLCLAAFDYIKNVSKLGGSHSAVLRIIIKPTNLVVLDMYKSLGFKVVDGVLSTLAEAAHCAGDQGSLPANYEEQKAYTTRGGLFMLKHVELY